MYSKLALNCLHNVYFELWLVVNKLYSMGQWLLAANLNSCNINFRYCILYTEFFFKNLQKELLFLFYYTSVSKVMTHQNNGLNIKKISSTNETFLLKISLREENAQRCHGSLYYHIPVKIPVWRAQRTVCITGKKKQRLHVIKTHKQNMLRQR